MNKIYPKQIFCLLFFACIIILSACLTAEAEIIRVPEDYPTIQEAIDAAVDGDVVLVNDGTYHERIHFSGKAITVTSVNGPVVTTIDADRQARTVDFYSGEGEDSVIEGFKITGGSTAGISCWNSSPTIRRNVIVANINLWNEGMGIKMIGSCAPVIMNNTIIGNKIGIDCGMNSTPIIKNNIIAGNGAASFSVDDFEDGTIIKRNNIWGNGLDYGFDYETNISEDPLFEAQQIQVTLQTGTIQDAINSITYRLGEDSPCIGAGEDGDNIGAYLTQDTYNAPGDSVIKAAAGFYQEDISLGPYTHLIGSGPGATILDGNGAHAVIRVAAEDRISIEGFTIRNGERGIACLYSNVTIKNNIIRNNPVGVYSQGAGASPIIKNNLIFAHLGTGISAMHKSAPQIINNTIVGDRHHYPSYGIIYDDTMDQTQIINNIIIDNRYGIYAVESPGLIDYNDVWDNIVGYGGEAQHGPHDIFENPLFINREVDHFSLSLDSPCIDTGDPEILDPDRTISNMGAYGGPEAKVLNITLVPGDTSVPRGSDLVFDVLLSNNFTSSKLWFADGKVVSFEGDISDEGPLFEDDTFTLEPYETIWIAGEYFVPLDAPLGQYSYIGQAGKSKHERVITGMGGPKDDEPPALLSQAVKIGGVIDTDSFSFNVIEGLFPRKR